MNVLKFPCRMEEEQVLAWARGVLSPEAASAVEDHVETCEACREAAEFESVRGILAPLRAPEPPPDVISGLTDDVMRRVSAKGSSPRRLAQAAAIMALMLGGALWLNPLAQRDPGIQFAEARPEPVVLASAEDVRVGLVEVESSFSQLFLSSPDEPGPAVVMMVIDDEIGEEL